MTDEKKEPRAPEPEPKPASVSAERRAVKPDAPAPELGPENPGYVAFFRAFGRS